MRFGLSVALSLCEPVPLLDSFVAFCLAHTFHQLFLSAVFYQSQCVSYTLTTFECHMQVNVTDRMAFRSLVREINTLDANTIDIAGETMCSLSVSPSACGRGCVSTL